MKNILSKAILGAIFLGAICGCAPARLSVSVDYFRFNPADRSALEAGERIRSLRENEITLSKNISAFFRHYREVQDTLLTAAMSEPGLTAAGRENWQTTHDDALKSAHEFEAQLAEDLKGLRVELGRAAEANTRLKSAGTRVKVSPEALLESARIKINEIRDKLAIELERQPKGSTRRGRLSLVELGDVVNKFRAKLGIDDLVLETSTFAAAVRSTNSELKVTDTLVREALSNAQKMTNTIDGVDPAINPDKSADDGDPFFQILADPTYTPSWTTNFFFQNTKSDGKVSFMIVRESPVRFTVNEAKTDPSVLIKTQLRSARAGIKMVGSVASALNPALPIPHGGSEGEGDTSLPGTTNSPKARSLQPQEEESRTQIALLNQKLQSFNTDLEKVRSDYAALEKKQASAAAADKAALDSLNDAQKAKTDAAKEAATAEKELEATKSSPETAGEEVTQATMAAESRKKDKEAAVEAQHKAEQVVITANDSKISAEKALAEAKTAEATANKDFEAAQNAKNDLTEVTKKRDAATQAVKTTGTNLKFAEDAITEAGKAAAKALQAVEPLKVAYDEAEKNRIAAVEKLKRSEKSHRDSQEKLAQATKTANDAGNAVQAAEDAKAKRATELASAKKAFDEAVKPDVWAKTYFDEQVKPSIQSYQAKLQKLLGAGSNK